MLLACALWGLMSPIGKDAMSHGLTGFEVIPLRMAIAGVLFWTVSLFRKHEHVERHDLLLMFVAALFAVVFNQGVFILGLSMTSPSNASIMTTTSPIFAMILSFIILHEPLTLKKIGGVVTGCAGAVIIILTSATAGNEKVGNLFGDILCISAQLSFALYLTLFKRLVQRYSLITLNKWMFLFANIVIWPFFGSSVAHLQLAAIPMQTWMEMLYIGAVGTFLCYMLMMQGQRILRPTVVAVYNYLQPVVAVTVSILAGMAVLKWQQAVAAVLVFSGVWMVIKSKSRRDIEQGKA